MTIIECPRDAIQGIHQWIPTERKILYINTLLRSKYFDSIDFGSFVSPKAIPQMADTADVVRGLDLTDTPTKLLAIVANLRGAEMAAQFEQISFWGYPFSISETFQIRNTQATIAESVERVKEIQNLAQKSKKELVIYISMGFGNPYGDPWNAEIVWHWVEQLQREGIRIFSLADTVGVASPTQIRELFGQLIPAYPQLVWGAHLHSTLHAWHEKAQAAFEGGCRRFDGALLGYGGCPMAQDALVGNMPTENLLNFAGIQAPVSDLQQAFREMINI
jgi:hydroxymethylglutaryl-CoA lyase